MSLDLLWYISYWGSGAKETGMMYFSDPKWGAKELQNPQNPRVVLKMNFVTFQCWDSFTTNNSHLGIFVCCKCFPSIKNPRIPHHPRSHWIPPLQVSKFFGWSLGRARQHWFGHSGSGRTSGGLSCDLSGEFTSQGEAEHWWTIWTSEFGGGIFMGIYPPWN